MTPGKARSLSVMESPQGKMVYIFADGKTANEHVAQPRPVTVGEWSGKDWVILDGLKPGDKVIVDGLTKLRPGEKILAKPVSAEAKPAAAKAAPPTGLKSPAAPPQPPPAAPAPAAQPAPGK